MAFVHYTEASGGLPNAGRLSGTNGDLVGIMDVVLVAAGWAIEYTSGFARVYRPATGNRFRLHMNDDSATSGAATLCVVRGCENATNATTLTDPFPQVAQVANGVCNWLKSSTANTTARTFDIYASDTWVFFAVNPAGTANVWEWHFFGDTPPLNSGDVYNTVCFVRNTSGVTPGIYTAVSSTGTGVTRIFFTRSYDGTVKSTQGSIVNGTGVGANTINFPPAQGGPTTKIDQEKTILADTGSQTTTMSSSLGLPKRAWLPNIWIPNHGGFGALNVRDTWVNNAYNPSATFTEFSTNTNNAFVIVEATNTWSPGAI